MGIVKKWQRRVEARAQQEREEQSRANALMAKVPDIAVFGPNAVRVRFEVRPSGEFQAPIFVFARPTDGTSVPPEAGRTVVSERIPDLPKHLEKGESGHVSDAIDADSVAKTCKALADEST